MDANRVDDLLRSLTKTPSRRAMTRALSGLAFGGPLGLLAAVETDAKRNKNKHRRRKKKRQRKKEPQPFCAGRVACVDPEEAVCDDGSGVECYCWVTAETGEPFCGQLATIVNTCTPCADEETCVDLSQCVGGGVGCSLPCPNPL